MTSLRQAEQIFRNATREQATVDILNSLQNERPRKAKDEKNYNATKSILMQSHYG